MRKRLEIVLYDRYGNALRKAIRHLDADSDPIYIPRESSYLTVDWITLDDEPSPPPAAPPPATPLF